MDNLALRFKLKLLIQISVSESEGPKPVKTLVVPKLTSLLGQRNIYESHLMDEHMVIFLDKFKYIFEDSDTLLAFKLPLIAYFYKRKRFKTEIFILGPILSHIFSKLMDIRNRRWLRWKIRRDREEKIASRRSRRARKIYLRRRRLRFNNQKKKKPIIFSYMDIFKSILLKHFFFSHTISLYVLKYHIVAIQGLIISLQDRIELKKRKINFRRKLRYDSEGRVVNL